MKESPSNVNQRIAARVGQFFGLAFIALGLYQFLVLQQGLSGLWTAGIGWLRLNDELNVGAGKGGDFQAYSWKPAIVVGGGLEQEVAENFSIAGQVLYARGDTVSALPQDTSYFASDLPVYYSNDVVLATINFIYRVN